MARGDGIRRAGRAHGRHRARDGGTDPAAIILLDIEMPGHDGLWFAERVKEGWPSTAIVFASGVDNIRTIDRTRFVGAVDFVPKPFQWEMVAQAMRRAGRAAGSAAR